MARSVQWRRTVSDTTSWRQDQGLAATIFIVREIGPTGFLLKEDGFKPCRVLLGDPHSCTCSGFRSEQNELCKHICWVLLKKFRVPREDATSWQLGLVEREINTLLQGEQKRRNAIRNRPETPRQAVSHLPSKDGRAALEQREISEEDTCPICMEELLAKREPVTYCKYSCANSIHIKCMKVWAEHQTSAGEKAIKCPYCREDFGPLEYLREEYKNTVVPGLRRPRVVEHNGTLCRGCNQSPIQGKCYRCTRCNEYHLCQKCFNSSIHPDHSFEFRSLAGQRWRVAQRVITNGLPVPPALVDNLLSRDIGDGDYDLLLQLDNPSAAQLSEVPESVIKKFPLERVRVGSRYLAPGEQCCVCLRSYQIGDYIRKLPCRHKFHRDCIDNWLLHQHPTCPVDGQVVWSNLTGGEETSSDNRPRRVRRQQTKPNNQTNQNSAANSGPSFEIPGIGILRRGSAPPTNLDTAQIMSDVRRAQSSDITSEHSRSIPSDTANSLQARDLSVNLAQLLLADAIGINGPSADVEQSYIRSQISNSRPPDSVMADRIADSRAQRLTNHTMVERRGVSAVSDSESENLRRRQRNLSLAANTRLMNRRIKETTSTPSISTAQPDGASSLYLGSFTENNQRITERPSRVVRGHRHSNHSTNHTQESPALGLHSLSIGSGVVESEGNRGTRSRPLNTKSKKVHKPKLHSPNLSLLELTGTKCDG